MTFLQTQPVRGPIHALPYTSQHRCPLGPSLARAPWSANTTAVLLRPEQDQLSPSLRISGVQASAKEAVKHTTKSVLVPASTRRHAGHLSSAARRSRSQVCAVLAGRCELARDQVKQAVKFKPVAASALYRTAGKGLSVVDVSQTWISVRRSSKAELSVL
ncbi:hypothetical protein WJX73_003232 [Symbiochloris irregularis]|uniref:Uncharacterized protein n=1 Tax=Symbiochloris irregularis TaxID=706552 RepID=A0AAW1NPF2_9CHLO